MYPQTGMKVQTSFGTDPLTVTKVDNVIRFSDGNWMTFFAWGWSSYMGLLTQVAEDE